MEFAEDLSKSEPDAVELVEPVSASLWSDRRILLQRALL
jgi:hypothetical protein